MNIALLTGRGGSVSIKDKNIMPVLGRPLMVYPFLAARHSDKIDAIYLSTDGEELKRVGREHGMGIIDRPPELASPTSQHIDCLLHALDYFRSANIRVDILVVLLCNVATHEIGVIDRCIQLLEDNPQADSCVTIVKKNECSPLIAKKRVGQRGQPKLDTDDPENVFYIAPHVEEAYTLPESRHHLPPACFLTHSIWALRVKNCFTSNGQPPWDFMGSNIIGLPVDGGCDIHEMEEVAYSEEWLRKHGWTENTVPTA